MMWDTLIVAGREPREVINALALYSAKHSVSFSDGFDLIGCFHVLRPSCEIVPNTVAALRLRTNTRPSTLHTGVYLMVLTRLPFLLSLSLAFAHVKMVPLEILSE